MTKARLSVADNFGPFGVAGFHKWPLFGQVLLPTTSFLRVAIPTARLVELIATAMGKST